MSSIQHILDSFHCTEKIDIRIGSDCQKAICKFSSTQKVVSFDKALSYEIREFLSLKRKCMRLFTTFKIVGHQDRVKQTKELAFDERINIVSDREAKKLICQQIRSNGSPPFPFRFQSPQMLNKHNQALSSAE